MTFIVWFFGCWILLIAMLYNPFIAVLGVVIPILLLMIDFGKSNDDEENDDE